MPCNLFARITNSGQNSVYRNASSIEGLLRKSGFADQAFTAVEEFPPVQESVKPQTNRRLWIDDTQFNPAIEQGDQVIMEDCEYEIAMVETGLGKGITVTLRRSIPLPVRNDAWRG